MKHMFNDTDVALLIPWRPSTPERQKIFTWVALRWTSIFPRIRHYIGHGPFGGEFNRSAARNHAANLADGAKIFILADADTVPQPDVLISAIYDAMAEQRCVLPYTTYYNLRPEETRAILKKKVDAPLPEPTKWIYKLDDSISGCVVIPSRIFYMVGGFDERFQAWGEEDRAFIEAVEVIHQPIHRLPGYVLHLYHDAPESVRFDNPHYAANQALYHRYRACTTKEDMLRVRFGS